MPLIVLGEVLKTVKCVHLVVVSEGSIRRQVQQQNLDANEALQRTKKTSCS